MPRLYIKETGLYHFG